MSYFKNNLQNQTYINSAHDVNSLCPLLHIPSLQFLPGTFDTRFLSVLRLRVIICVAAVTVVFGTRILLLLFVASIGHPTLGEASLLKGEVTGFYTLVAPTECISNNITSNLGRCKLDMLILILLSKTTQKTQQTIITSLSLKNQHIWLWKMIQRSKGRYTIVLNKKYAGYICK